MAIRVTRPRTQWWHRFPHRVCGSAETVTSIVQAAAATPGRFPHIRLRMVEGRPEAYVLGSGLDVWEVAWLARAYDGDAEAIERHTGAERELIEEGLRYAAEHAAEIDAQISLHTERSLEELLELLPGMRVITVDVSEPDGQHT